MNGAYNVYCDESCHLENDRHRVMVLGAVWSPLAKSREINERLREIKQDHGLARDFEVKWAKVSPAKMAFYRDILDYFFDDDDLHFRALVVPDKSSLQHETFNQDHDTWYYKMYFDMLKVILKPDNQYRVYLDIKDTLGQEKIEKLHEVLANNMYDFERSILERFQSVRSHEIEQLQLADLLIGTVGYANRLQESNLGLNNAGKLTLVNRMKKRSGYRLTRNTLIQEEKVNIFIWRPRERTWPGEA